MGNRQTKVVPPPPNKQVILDTAISYVLFRIDGHFTTVSFDSLQEYVFDKTHHKFDGGVLFESIAHLVNYLYVYNTNGIAFVFHKGKIVPV